MDRREKLLPTDSIMINFEFKWDAKDYEFLFSKYSTINGELKGSSVTIIYRLMMTEPFDGLRTHSIEAGTKLTVLHRFLWCR
jgi:hypothetical protein